jgi:tetratricopeptide (TPR) repeat protein
MKYLLFFILTGITSLHAQDVLKFDKRFVESEDRWVAFQKGKDSTYVYGFIYIDAQAGLTLNYEGNFRIADDGVFLPKKLDSVNFKMRLEPNNVRVAWIPETKCKELQIDATPDWLQFYKTDTGSIERLYRWGFLYNAWDESEKALTYLERGQKINPKFKGLEFELAYAYNALGQFDKAVTVLQSAIETTPNNCLLYKELSFAEMHLGQLQKAGETCKKGLSVCSDKALKAEIAYNMAYQYYKRTDRENFRSWANETKKWATNGDQFMKAINKMEEDLFR